MSHPHQHDPDRRGLRDTDPFAAPASRPNGVTGHHPQAVPGTETMYPCPCACGCGGETSLPVSKVESAQAAVWLRCNRCLTLGHLTAAYNKTPEQDRPARTIEVRSSAQQDAEEAELDRMAAAEVDRLRREEAKAAFYDALPARWKADQPGDRLEPQVEDRLRRMATGQGEHGLGLLCIGTFGGGKTWVGFSYIRQAIERGLVWPTQVRYGTEGDLMSKVAYAGYEFPAEMKKLLNPRYKITMMDDVGTTGTYPDKEKRHSLYSQVFDFIYANNLALIVTTNLEPGIGKSLEKWVGPAAYQRLKNIVGPDLVVRDTDKRAELTARWEAEYRANIAETDA